MSKAAHQGDVGLCTQVSCKERLAKAGEIRDLEQKQSENAPSQ